MKLTQKAIENIQGLIRLRVKTTGCNGFSYSFESITKRGVNDIPLHPNFFIDYNSMNFISHDLIIDYEEREFKKGFIVINPREDSRCGCGESFSV